MYRKYSIFFLSLLFSLCVEAQLGDQFHNWNFSYGRTGTPGDQLKAGLEYAYTPKFSLYGEPSVEWSKYQGLRYNSIGLLLGGRYYLYGGNDMANNTKLNVLMGLNLATEYNIENSLLKNRTFMQKLNYGLAAQVLMEYYFDQTLGFFVGGEQKILFNESLGKYNYSVFTGIRIHFGNN